MYTVGKKLLVLALALVSVFILAGCGAKKITNTSIVSLKYTASFQDSSLFEEKELIDVALGQGQIVQGLEEGIVGMSKGKTKKIVVSPDKGYGKYYDPAKIQKLSQDLVGVTDLGSVVKIGSEDAIVIGFEGEDSGTIVLDINPKNTRQDLSYDVEILDVK